MRGPCSARSALFGRDLAYRFGPWFREELLRQQAFDDEQGGQRTADRDRQIGHAGGDNRKFSDALIPGGLDQLDAPPQHEEIGRQHADFEEPAEHWLDLLPQQAGDHADADVQFFWQRLLHVLDALDQRGVLRRMLVPDRFDRVLEWLEVSNLVDLGTDFLHVLDRLLLH